MSIYADHWLYQYIPRHRDELTNKSCCQKIFWAVFGNDSDGIFGEGPHSGEKWTKKWNGKHCSECKYHEAGTINFKRFLLWQLRNPLHNFTAYVIGFKGKKNVSFTQLLLISTVKFSFYKKLINRPDVFPMQDHSGIYAGSHGKRPFISWRVNLISIRWLEGYFGWRPGGGFGITFRLKKSIKIKPNLSLNSA